jgi:hypothetical protein
MRALKEDQRIRITWKIIAEHLGCVTCGSGKLIRRRAEGASGVNS